MGTGSGQRPVYQIVECDVPPVGEGLNPTGRQAKRSQEILVSRMVERVASLLAGVGQGWSVLNEEP